MKRVSIAALAATLLASTAGQALAQEGPVGRAAREAAERAQAYQGGPPPAPEARTPPPARPAPEARRGHRHPHHWQYGMDRRYYDPRLYPPTYHLDRRYRVSPYHMPRGYFSHQWRFGDRLPYGWYNSRHQVMDWFRYGLPMPPIGHAWVQVGRDVVLVDTFDGQVKAVAPGAFWW